MKTFTFALLSAEFQYMAGKFSQETLAQMLHDLLGNETSYLAFSNKSQKKKNSKSSKQVAWLKTPWQLSIIETWPKW